jgi:hypothetical protein
MALAAQGRDEGSPIRPREPLGPAGTETSADD